MPRQSVITAIYQTLLLWLAMAVLLILLYNLTGPLHRLDTGVLTWADSLRAPFLDSFFKTITWLGSLYVLLPVMILIVFALNMRGQQHEAWFLAISLAGASLLNHFAKLAFNRQRPDLYPPLIPRPLDASFPSGHSAQILAFVISLSVILYRRKITGPGRGYISLAIGMGILVVFSRIYLQVHYPSDTLAGLILASCWVVSVAKVVSIFRFETGSTQHGRKSRK